MSKVRIIAKIRPFLANEQPDDGVRVEDSALSLANPRNPSQRIVYRDFAACYDESSTGPESQRDLFNEELGQWIGECFNGKTLAVMCYGVTSSGKTYTMQGCRGNSGIVASSVEALLSWAAGMPQRRFEFTLEYVEVYCNDCRDLLASSQGSKVAIQSDKNNRTKISKQETERFSTYDEFERKFKDANKRRATAATALNRSSSRSHAILTIRVFEQPQGESALPYALGKIQLVDLAGSEKFEPGSSSVQIQEAKFINISLSALSRVITALNTDSDVIPYRESKLTRLLQEAFSGNSRTLVICNIAPGRKFLSGTRSTIEFATKAKSVKATKNEAAEKEAQQRIERRRNEDPEFNIAVQAEADRQVALIRAQMENDRLNSLNSISESSSSLPALPLGPSTDQTEMDAPSKDGSGPDYGNATSNQVQQSQPEIPQVSNKELQLQKKDKNYHPDKIGQSKVLSSTTAEQEEREKYRRRLDKGLEKKLDKYRSGDPRVDRGKYARACIIAGKMALDERNDLEYAVILFEKAIGLYPENERLLEETLSLKKRLRAEREGNADGGNPSAAKAAPLLSTRKGNNDPSSSLKPKAMKLGAKSEERKVAKNVMKGKKREALAAAVAAFGESDKEGSGSEDEVEKSLGAIEHSDLSDEE
ncbi:hypothetical protein FRC19_004276, partial [Serendipita sp. 401]